MKTTYGLISLCVLVMGAQVAQAQLRHPSVHEPRIILSGASGLVATDEVLGDAMVLPLLGMSDHIDGRLAFLQTELKINPAQRALWDAFSTAARANASQERAMLMQESSAMGNDNTIPSLPQRLETQERQLRAHLKMLQTISAALLPLYASFSEEQRKTAEDLANGVPWLQPQR